MFFLSSTSLEQLLITQDSASIWKTDRVLHKFHSSHIRSCSELLQSTSQTFRGAEQLLLSLVASAALQAAGMALSDHQAMGENSCQGWRQLVSRAQREGKVRLPCSQLILSPRGDPASDRHKLLAF